MFWNVVELVAIIVIGYAFALWLVKLVDEDKGKK
jgi:hypothetical protein